MSNATMMPYCAITGASGYVGARLAASLRARGARVLELNRSGRARRPDNEAAAYSLGDEPAPETLAGMDALIHCAYDFGAHSRGEVWRSNVEGSLRLFAAARTAGVRRMLFVSTVSAYEGCRSLYGQAKLAVEQKG